jgi:hypothetical protein
LQLLRNDACDGVGTAASSKSNDDPDGPVRVINLLSTRRDGPRRCAAEKRDELAPLHSITSSAVASTPGGMSTATTFLSSCCKREHNNLSETYDPLRD